MRKRKISGIYKITNKLDGNSYIGSSIDTQNRWYLHKYQLKAANKHHSNYLQRAWDKHGAENFEFSVIEECIPDKELLLEREQFYLDSEKPVYNMLPTAGSNLGFKATQETKDKQAKSMIGKNVGKRHTPEVRAQMFVTHKHTDESKAKLSAAHTGKVHKEETKKKMAEARVGYVPKPESIAKTTRKRHEKRLQKLAEMVALIPTDISTKYLTEGNRKRRSLTDDVIREIRCSELMDKTLAEMHGVSSSAIRKIRLRVLYRDIA